MSYVGGNYAFGRSRLSIPRLAFQIDVASHRHICIGIMVMDQPVFSCSNCSSALFHNFKFCLYQISMTGFTCVRVVVAVAVRECVCEQFDCIYVRCCIQRIELRILRNENCHETICLVRYSGRLLDQFKLLMIFASAPPQCVW